MVGYAFPRVRRCAATLRLRASLATICSSQGRNGAPSRKRSRLRWALMNPSWAASSASCVCIFSREVDVLLDPFSASWAQMREAALTAEQAGFGGIWTWDHLAGVEKMQTLLCHRAFCRR